MANLRRGFYAVLPQRGLSRLGAWAARLRAGSLTTAFIRWFVRHYGVVMREAAEPDPNAYQTFNAFFTRALAAGTRPQPDNPTALASPVDGVVSVSGPIAEDTLFQAKGYRYSAAALLGDAEAAARYANGVFAALYLRPRDYHRVHAPLAGELRRIRHIPGNLWPVRPWAVQGVANLFARNERLVLEFVSEGTPWTLVMIGALMVGGLETVATGPIRRDRRQPDEWNLEIAPRAFARGEEIGRFNFGSAVILLFPRNTVTFSDSLCPGTELQLGGVIGTRNSELGTR